MSVLIVIDQIVIIKRGKLIEGHAIAEVAVVQELILKAVGIDCSIQQLLLQGRVILVVSTV